jgi:hypothetical protein
MECAHVSSLVTRGAFLNRKIVISINTSWNFVNFRSGLIRTLIRRGYEVVAISPADAYTDALSQLGCRVLNLSIDRYSKNIFRNLVLLWGYYQLLKIERPNVFLAYTSKPNIFGSISAHLLGIPVINNISGLGQIFARRNYEFYLVCGLYKIALSRSKKIFFQNK